MLTELEGGSDPTKGDRSGGAASFIVSERSESSDLFYSTKPVESLTTHSDLQMQDPTSEVKSLWNLHP